MNNRRSYLDSMNAGRRRRSSSTIEQISQSLDELESRIRRPYDTREERGIEEAGRHMPREARRLASETAYYEPPARGGKETFRTLARDIERNRTQQDGLATIGGIAGEISELRDELRHQMGAGLRREFAALKADIDRAFTASNPVGQAAELRVEFERLSGMIHQLAERSDDKHVNLLRLEMEQVKNALGKLAREETVQSVDRRWDEFDQRWTDFESRVSSAQSGASDPALQALTTRLEQISEAVNSLPTSVVLRSLEEKMKILAAAVDQFAHQQDRIGPEALDAIEERLDEISRAVAASTAAAQPATFDPEPFQRIEARISSLARQIGEVVEDNPANGLLDQLTALSMRVDGLAQRIDLPDRAVERLAEQIAAIAQKLDSGPSLPAMDDVFHGIENRFATLSGLLEQRHEDALVQGQSLFHDLERRLDEVAGRIEQREAAAPNGGAHLLEAMDARFAELATRMEGRQAAPADDSAIRNLEARLESISARLETSVSQPGIDPDLIRSLEAQVAGLSAHIARPGAALPDFEDVRPRLDKIEQSIAENRQDVLAVARQAAEEAVRSFSGSPAEGALVSGLVDDLKSLETLTRKSDDRNTKTFEAIHDTLLKIVDRLGSVEAGADTTNRAARPDTSFREMPLELAETPPLDPEADDLPFTAQADDGLSNRTQTMPGSRRTAAAAAAEAAADAIKSDTQIVKAEKPGKRSMLGGLTRALSGRKVKQAKADPAETAPAATTVPAPEIEMDTPLDPQLANQPLEPGSGAPDLNAIMKRVRDERGPPARAADSDAAKSDFIAAARRAAQAAAAEAEMMKRSPIAKSRAVGFGFGGLLKKRSKPVLMGVAAILMALAAVQLGKSYMADPEQVAEDSAAPAAIVETADLDEAPVEDTVAEARTPEQPVRVVDRPDQPTVSALLAQAPETAADVTTDWLDTAEPVVAETPEESKPAEAAETAPLSEETAAIPEEIGALPEPSEEMLASIPMDAGPVALREAAAAGDPKALFEIGNRYAEGRGVEEDMAQAAGWYEKAADQGLAPAQYRIGNLYEKGVGVERDVAKAKTWYQLAAAQGNASAMHNLAVLFAMGADGTTDNESAARWFVEAAELGVRDSQFNLGILSAKGVGMKQDLEEAYKWFALVADAGDKDAAAKRDEIAKVLSPEQLEKARAAAELWKPKTVDPEANLVEVPDSWSEGKGTTAGIDLKQAVRNIQAILNKNGYEAGAEDGIMGGKTTAAIAAFQKDNGMEATGEIDEKLVRALLDRG